MMITVDPMMERKHPTFPWRFNFSFNKVEDSTALMKATDSPKDWVSIPPPPHYLTNTLSAPRGVTNIAGANPYAAKLAASPTAMVISPTHQSHSFR